MFKKKLTTYLFMLFAFKNVSKFCFLFTNNNKKVMLLHVLKCPVLF